MKCINPIRLTNVKGQAYYVPCGKCAWCLKLKRDQWFFRLYQEKMNVPYSRFLTLTYRDQDLPSHVDEDGVIHYDVSKSDIRHFLRSLYKRGLKFRYMLTAEYGHDIGQAIPYRPHYHGVFFSNTRYDYLKSWTKGDCNLDVVAKDGSLKYIVKYVLKGSKVPVGSAPLFHSESRRPGIGSSFIYKGEPYVLGPGGVKLVPGHYYRRNYIARLNDQLQSVEKEKVMDYLVSTDPFDRLRQQYELLNDPSLDFDTWLSDIYMRDFNNQIKINQK